MFLPDLRLFIIISLFSICSLKDINILYSLKMSYERPIIAQEYIFYLRGNEIKALSKEYYSYDMFDNSYRRPLMNIGDKVFFVKDCRLEMYQYQGKDTLRKKNVFEKYFDELEGDKCDSTLDIFYDYKRKDIVVYNTKNNKIIVFNLKDINKYGTNDNYIGQIKMDHDIMQALIYNYNKDTSILIGIDNHKINFYNLRGSYSLLDKLKNNRLIDSIELNNPISNSYGRKIAGIMKIDNKQNILLFIDNDIYLYDLNNFKLISSYSIHYPSTVLTSLDDGIALIGDYEGNIKVFEFKNKKLYFLEEYFVCNGNVLDISYDNTRYYNSNYMLVQCYEDNGIFLKHISLKSESFIISPFFIIYFFLFLITLN